MSQSPDVPQPGMPETGAPDMTSRVARITRIEEAVLRLADLPEPRLKAIFEQAQRREALREKIGKYAVVPLGAVGIPLFAATAFFVSDESTRTMMTVPMGLAILSVMIREIVLPLNYSDLREEVRRRALRNAIRDSAPAAPRNSP